MKLYIGVTKNESGFPELIFVRTTPPPQYQIDSMRKHGHKSAVFEIEPFDDSFARVITKEIPPIQ